MILSIPYDGIFMTITIKLDNLNKSQICTNHILEETDRLVSHVLRNITSYWAIWQSQMVQQVSHGKTMKIRELGGVKVESVFIREDFRPLDVYDLQQVTAQFTKESTAMISLNIFHDIMALYKVSIKISSLFAGQFPHNISVALNEG